MPSKTKPDLWTAAHTLAAEMSRVVNGSIGHGTPISALTGTRDQVLIGFDITHSDAVVTTAAPVGKRKRLYLGLSYGLRLNAHGFLMVETSFVGLFLDGQMHEELLHFDYERDKADGYPEAHVQVIADSDHWRTLLAACPDANRPLGKLHLPVGGRRFRPALEHVVEFLIMEHLVEPTCDNWVQTLERSRREFELNQLRAAIWRNPDVAQQALNDYHASQVSQPKGTTKPRKGGRRGGKEPNPARTLSQSEPVEGLHP